MLVVGLQKIDRSQIHLPLQELQRPDRDRLAKRYELLVAAG